MSNQFTATVRDLSHKGLGVIDHPDGRVFFARGTWPGDEGLFEVEADAQRYAEARLLRLLSPSPDRVELPCPHRGTEPGKCGGCPWMIGSYESQLQHKLKRLRYALEKRRISPSKVKDVLPSPRVFDYRNRIQLKTTGEKLGFVSEASSVFAPVEDCLILNAPLRKLFHELKDSLPRADFIPGPGYQWNYLDLDDELALEEVKVNRRRPFRQGNTQQNEKMRTWVREQFSKLPRHWPVVDLFCGSGNFTEVLSDLGFRNILAVEVQGVALELLRRKQLPGVRILELDVNAKGSWAQIAKHQPHAKAMLVDPPREGMPKRRGLYRYLDNLQNLFYISCELDTYARDVQDLIKNGWQLEELTPIDLFPHTPHLELMSSLQRQL